MAGDISLLPQKEKSAKTTDTIAELTDNGRAFAVEGYEERSGDLPESALIENPNP
jgi:hypothetical protein